MFVVGSLELAKGGRLATRGASRFLDEPVPMARWLRRDVVGGTMVV